MHRKHRSAEAPHEDASRPPVRILVLCTVDSAPRGVVRALYGPTSTGVDGVLLAP